MKKADRIKLKQEIIDMANKGYYTQELATMFNKSHQYIRILLKEHNISTNFHKLRTEKRTKILIEKAEELARKLDRLPLLSELYEYTKYKNDKAIQASRKYLIQLGFKRKKRSDIFQKYSEEFLINHLKEISQQLGKTPSVQEIDKAGDIKATTYIRFFGSLCKAQELAGLIPNQKAGFKKYSDEFLINFMKDLSSQLSKTPTAIDIKNVNKVSIKAFINHFGSIRKAQEAAGLVPNSKVGRQKYTEEFLLNCMKELSKELGKTPSKDDIEKYHKVSPTAYVKRFGSICKAQEAAGLVPTKRGNSIKYSDEYLLDHLRVIAKLLDRTPSCYDLKSSGKISITAYVKRFGSVSNAQAKAGLVPHRIPKKKKTIV